jgi:hypothetical protein
VGERTEVATRLHPESPAASPLVVAMVIDVLTALSSASAKGAGRRLAERERLALELGLYLAPSPGGGLGSADHPGG